MRCTSVAGILLGSLLTGAGPAADSIQLGAGLANDNIDVRRIAWQKPWSTVWLASESGELSGMHAMSFNQWKLHDESVEVVAYSPVFVYRWGDGPVSTIRFGIGAAYLSQTQIGNRRLSTHFQFEDQIGIGWRWRRHTLGLDYLHYSNAGIEKPNQGIDIIMLSYAFELD